MRNHRVPLRALIAALVGVVLVGAFVPVLAQHRRPPKVVVKAPGAWQRGVLGTYCWSYVDRGSNEGTGFCADSLHGFPEAEPAGAGDPARFRLWAPKRPAELSILFWRELDENGQPVGDGEAIPAELRPHRKDGELVAFDALFDLPTETGDHYLWVFAKWEEIRYGHGRGEGDGSWDFHLTLE